MNIRIREFLVKGYRAKRNFGFDKVFILNACKML